MFQKYYVKSITISFQKKGKSKMLSYNEIVLITMLSIAAAVLLCYIFARLFSRYQKRRYSSELERVDSLVQSYIELNTDRERQQDEN